MRDHIYRATWTLDIQRHYVDVCTFSPVMDSRWSFTDAAGHTHTPDSGTWHRVQDDPREPYFYTDDDGEEYNAPTHIECRECGERLRPDAVEASPFVEAIPGAITVTLTGIRSDGQTVSAVVTEEEARSIASATDTLTAERTVRSLLDAMPPERITHISR